MLGYYFAKLRFSDGICTFKLEDTVIAILKTENEIKVVNTVGELPLTVEEIKVKSETDNFIKKRKNQVRFKENRTDLPECNYYSICDGILIYVEWEVISCSLQKKKNTKWIPFKESRDV